MTKDELRAELLHKIEFAAAAVVDCTKRYGYWTPQTGYWRGNLDALKQVLTLLDKPQVGT